MLVNVLVGQADLLKGHQRERLLILAQQLYDERLFSQCFMVCINDRRFVEFRSRYLR